jgi:hypothetical protein
MHHAGLIIAVARPQVACVRPAPSTVVTQRVAAMAHFVSESSLLLLLHALCTPAAVALTHVSVPIRKRTSGKGSCRPSACCRPVLISRSRECHRLGHVAMSLVWSHAPHELDCARAALRFCNALLQPSRSLACCPGPRVVLTCRKLSLMQLRLCD